MRSLFNHDVPYLMREMIISGFWKDFYKNEKLFFINNNYTEFIVEIINKKNKNINIVLSITLLDEQFSHLFGTDIVIIDNISNKHKIDMSNNLHPNYIKSLVSRQKTYTGDLFKHTNSSRDFYSRQIQDPNFSDNFHLKCKLSELLKNEINKVPCRCQKKHKNNFRGTFFDVEFMFKLKFTILMLSEFIESKDRIQKRNKTIKDELIEKTWEPCRFFNWCVDEDNKKDIINRWV